MQLRFQLAVQVQPHGGVGGGRPVGGGGEGPVQIGRDAGLGGHGARQVEEGAPRGGIPPAGVSARAEGLEVFFQGRAPRFGEGEVMRCGGEVGFRGRGDRWRVGCLGGEVGVEGEEVGEALLDGEGAEGEAEGDGVCGVGFGVSGELGGGDGDLHGGLGRGCVWCGI